MSYVAFGFFRHNTTPDWVFVLTAALLFVYQTLDACDGKQVISSVIAPRGIAHGLRRACVRVGAANKELECAG